MINAKERLYHVAQEDYCPDLVRVDPDAVATLPAPTAPLTLMSSGLQDHPAGQSPVTAAAYVIALNSLNFMFWYKTSAGLQRYEWGGESGALGMRKAFDAAWGDCATPALVRQRLGTGRPTAINNALGAISLPCERAELLAEVLVGDTLERAAEWLAAKAAKGHLCVADAEELARCFPEAYGRDLYLKRAQLALMWFAGYLSERGAAPTLDLTVASDYQLPRVMRALGVLRYAPALARKVDALELINPLSAEELAIRAATILGAKAIADHFQVSEPAVDNLLWQLRRSCGETPHHLTMTTDY